MIAISSESTRHTALCDERIERIGAVAAGAAHELSSPLASIEMIVEELRRDRAGARERDDSLALVLQLLSACRRTLHDLLSCANGMPEPPPQRVRCDAFVRACIERYAVRRPASPLSLHIATPGPPPAMLATRSLQQALVSLVDNAIDASPLCVELSLAWERQWIRIAVRDRGPGIPSDIADTLGKAMFVTTKEHGKGNGLGLYLASGAVARLGGSFSIANADGEGAVAEMLLPAYE